MSKKQEQEAKTSLEKLDELTKDILTNSGTVSHQQALEKAHKEYDKYMKTHLTIAERDYIEILNKSVSDLEK